MKKHDNFKTRVHKRKTQRRSYDVTKHKRVIAVSIEGVTSIRSIFIRSGKVKFEDLASKSESCLKQMVSSSVTNRNIRKIQINNQVGKLFV